MVEFGTQPKSDGSIGRVEGFNTSLCIIMPSWIVDELIRSDTIADNPHLVESGYPKPMS